jgi:uncharacterized SAM-binding protein YcdF (DUF218 family)
MRRNRTETALIMRPWPLARVIAVCLLVVSGWAVVQVANILGVWRESQTIVQHSALAIVLGHKENAQGAGSHFQQRLDRAVAIFRAGEVDRILVTGGGHPPEAVVGQQYLISKGIPAESVLIETESCSTDENLRNSKSILTRLGADGPVLLITNGFHLKRSLMIANKYHLTATGVAAEETGPYLGASISVLREVAALAVRALWVSPLSC